MDHDPRDEIWNATWETYYDSYYHAIVADKLVGCWEVFDQSTKVLVAITASGSAIAGWSLWSNPGYHTLWICIAGFAALLSIVHAALSVADRLQDAVELKRIFGALRVKLETFQQRMRIDPDFSICEFTNELLEYRRGFGDCQSAVKRDILRTRWLKRRAQNDLNTLLKIGDAVK